MRKPFPEYDTFVPVPPPVQAGSSTNPSESEAVIGGPLSNPGGSAMSAGFFELKTSEPVGMHARRLSCEIDHFEDYSLKLQCNSFNFQESCDGRGVPWR